MALLNHTPSGGKNQKKKVKESSRLINTKDTPPPKPPRGTRGEATGGKREVQSSLDEAAKLKTSPQWAFLQRGPTPPKANPRDSQALGRYLPAYQPASLAVSLSLSLSDPHMCPPFYRSLFVGRMEEIRREGTPVVCTSRSFFDLRCPPSLLLLPPFSSSFFLASFLCLFNVLGGEGEAGGVWRGCRCRCR